MADPSKPVLWKPKENITTHELALAVDVRDHIAGRPYGYAIIYLSEQPAGVRRHFEVQ